MKRKRQSSLTARRRRQALAGLYLFLLAVLLFQLLLCAFFVRSVHLTAGGLVELPHQFNERRRLPLSHKGIAAVAEELKAVSTKFYIYNDYSISLSLQLEFLRGQGEVALTDHAKLDHVMSDIAAERSALEALETHPLRTMDPDEATFFVIPTPISELLAYGCRWEKCTYYDKAFHALSQHDIFKKTRGHNHVLISFGWYSFNQRYVAFFPALSRHYPQLENVTIASHYDPFGCVKLAKGTEISPAKGFNALFPREQPLTKAFSIGLGIDAAFPLQRPSFQKFKSSQYFLFYHSRNATEEPFGYGSTKYRQALFDDPAIELLPRSSIGNELNKKIWASNFVSSKFCLIVRGDTPHSHSLMYSIRAGCVPVVVSDYYQEYAGPFKSSLSMQDFCIFIKESKFLLDPVRELLKLQNLSDDFLSTKLSNLAAVQTILLPDYPGSLFVEAFMREMKVASQKIVPSVAARIPVEMGEDEVTISGKKLRYRYPTSFSSKETNKKNEPKLVVGVLSSAQKPDARLAIRSTWAEDYRNRVLFLVGGPWENVAREFFMQGDLLWIDIPEDYNLLTYKTRVFLHAVEAHVDYDYVMKTDDDSYVGIEEVTRILCKFQPSYYGLCVYDEKVRVVSRDPDYYWYTSENIYAGDAYPVYAQGLGYVLSRDFNKFAVTKFANNDYLPWEDAATGIICGAMWRHMQDGRMGLLG